MAIKICGNTLLPNSNSANCNTALGISSQNSVTSGLSNTAVGYQSLYTNATGCNNVAVGRGALYLSAAATGGSNIGIGLNAGCAITTGTNNTVIGNLIAAATCSDTVLIGAGSTERIKVDGTGLSINGTPFTGSSTTISNDTTCNITRYILTNENCSGTLSTAYVACSKLYFNPSTGTTYSTIFQSLSDRNLKDNIEPITEGLCVINKLNPVSYQWCDSGKKSYGVIAQEIEEILPNVVDTVDGKKSVEYHSIIAFLVKAVKELSSRVDEIESSYVRV